MSSHWDELSCLIDNFDIGMMIYIILMMINKAYLSFNQISIYLSEDETNIRVHKLEKAYNIHSQTKNQEMRQISEVMQRKRQKGTIFF